LEKWVKEHYKVQWVLPDRSGLYRGWVTRRKKIMFENDYAKGREGVDVIHWSTPRRKEEKATRSFTTQNGRRGELKGEGGKTIIKDKQRNKCGWDKIRGCKKNKTQRGERASAENTCWVRLMSRKKFKCTER